MLTWCTFSDYHYYANLLLEFETGGDITYPTGSGLFFAGGVYSYWYDYDECSRLSKN